MNVIQSELVTQYAPRLAEESNSGYIQLFVTDQISDLARLYRIFSRSSSPLKFVQKTVTDLIKQTGAEILKDPKNVKVCHSFFSFLAFMLRYSFFFLKFSSPSHRSNRNFWWIGSYTRRKSLGRS